MAILKELVSFSPFQNSLKLLGAILHESSIYFLWGDTNQVF